VANARVRLSTIIEKLGGRPLPAGSANTQIYPGPANSTRPAESKLVELEAEFLAMHTMGDEAQARGYAFERFLKKWFDAWGLDARGSFKLKGEQIDGSFLHRGSVYLIEAKWRNAPTDASPLRAFQETVGDHFEGARPIRLLFRFHSRRAARVYRQTCGDDGWNGH
jgi:hypothetical protein